MSETKKVIKMEEAQNNKESYTTVYIVQYSIVYYSRVQYTIV